MTVARTRGRLMVSVPARGRVGPRAEANPMNTTDPTTPIRVLVVDDHPMIRQGICLNLAKHPRLVVVGEAENGRQALELARQLQPDVILLDISMPGMDGLEAARQLRRDCPRSKVLIFTMHDDEQHVVQVIRAGAHGYLMKDSATEELIRAIETVVTDRTFFSPEAARHVVSALSHRETNAAAGAPRALSRREREVLVLIAAGKSNPEIAAQLGLGARTVQTHRERMMRKLNVHSVAELTRYAIATGLVSAR